jgi:DNA-binding transcriptional MerR regulator
MSDGTLAIGTFSRASGLSVKTLRAYHESGLLVPDSVDARTGYRAYTVAQLADAAVIVRLRALDVPLAQVREVLTARSPELTRRVLSDHQATMEARLDETARIIAELQSGAAPVTHTPVHVRSEPAQHTMRIVEDVPVVSFAAWLADAQAELAGFVASAGVSAVGPPGLLCGAAIEDDDVERLEAFVPVAVPVEGRGRIGVGEVPAADVAVLVHAGDLDSLLDSYRTLGAWVADNAEPSGDRIREWYVAPERTEIAWPVVESTNTRRELARRAPRVDEPSSSACGRPRAR